MQQHAKGYYPCREVGKVATNYHAVSLRLKSVAVDQEQQVEGEQPHPEEQDSVAPSMTTTNATSLSQGTKVRLLRVTKLDTSGHMSNQFTLEKQAYPSFKLLLQN